MKTTLFYTLILTTALSFGAFAADSKDSAISSEGQNVEKIVQTLNETLLENRTIKDELSKRQNEIDSIKAQNNLLMSQIRQMQTEVVASKRDVEVASTQVNTQKSEFEKEKANFEEERTKFDSEKKGIEQKQQETSKENDRLKNLLDHAVLKEEGEQYKLLLKKAEDSYKGALNKMARANREKEKYRRELAEQYYASGNLFYEKEDYKRAVESYKKALRLNPNDAWAHHNLGVIYDFYLNDNKKAIHHYKRYLQVKSIKEEAREIRERVLHLELAKLVSPRVPIKSDFDQYQKDLKLKTTQ